ncbi:MAG: MerR family transcriptional regulator [Acidobacteria bacterium]|nr:MerR family transcriptional regulator [Acidobacteriota bacterium]
MIMSTGEVAKRLGCTDENVRMLERAGKLKAEKTASGLRIFASEVVEEFARQREARKQKKAA